jgi:biotin-(acetyl-CoA carboxylase) ligase
MELFTGFADTGFEPYRAEWIDAHVLAGQAIELRSGSGTQYATVRGIDTDGALIVEDENGARRSVISGDVTIRVQRDAGD